MTEATPDVYPSIHTNALVRSLGYLMLIDLLVLPYVSFPVMPYTLAVVVVWALCRLKVHIDRDLKLFLIVAVCVAVSAAFSALYRPPEIVVENVKRAGQLLTTFAYYFFFRWVARDRRFNPKPILLSFVVFHTLWSLWFLASPLAATEPVLRVYPLAGLTAENNMMYSRFAYLFMDANTNGYFIAMLGLYLAQFGEMSAIGSVFVLAMMSVGVIASGSRGVLVALVIVAAQIVVRERHRILHHALRIVPATVILAMIAIAGFRYWSAREPDKMLVFFETFTTAKSRLLGQEGQTLQDVMIRGQTSAGESRLSTYRSVLTSFWPLPLGRGYLANGESVFRPHSDFLRMIYSYGFIACMAIIVFLFRDAWSIYFSVPALIAFAVNSLFDEQKLFAVYVALLAIARVRHRLLKMEKSRDVVRMRTAPVAAPATATGAMVRT